MEAKPQHLPIPSTFLATQVVKVIKNNAKINVQVGEEYQNSIKDFSLWIKIPIEASLGLVDANYYI